ncbi:DUF3107 domain-containing protein [Brevibacterium sp. 50QC2O2]|uniref:DUF3107 domain-containing protein n=1 Tax=unclassified Brevibacterium TaxID=2614124 RepID=UPI00211D03AC|nr:MULTISPECIES: DUF3107 domain-containing protein [unclassified Brevibacterium]MCQ9368432.1 DUF3107 domain-containing protein [Brevibacterium sp. 91QC2O2]MCQ9387523.1 DUF3107 domain-containing protein [Brevibacterium sp. 50QC2O2]
MEIKIGVRQSNRELALDSQLTADELATKVDGALKDGTTLVLEDAKGRKVIVPAAALAYVEVGAETPGRVGFGI